MPIPSGPTNKAPWLSRRSALLLLSAGILVVFLAYLGLWGTQTSACLFLGCTSTTQRVGFKTVGSQRQSYAASNNLPKVAMMFLTVGELRHELLWSEWFSRSETDWQAACRQTSACKLPAKVSSTDSGRLGSMALFSVYVHLPPDKPLLPETSLFSGAEIIDRISASWGSFELAQITRNLLVAALKDLSNERFITVSEACVPLYPPSVVYSQLMGTHKSRINACTSRKDWGTDGYRWSWRLTEVTNGSLTQDMWRKNHQWLGLIRKHALLMIEDRDIAAAFKQHCYSGPDPDFGGWWRTCISDEHYFSTLLAYHKLEQETDCYGELTHTEWCGHCDGDERLHPRTYKGPEVNIGLLRDLRQQSLECNAHTALESSKRFLQDQAVVATVGGMHSPTYLMAPRCPLFARKFSDDAVSQVRDTLETLYREDMHLT